MDAWDHLRCELGPAVAEELLRRWRAIEAGEVALHLRKGHRGRLVDAWVSPPERIPLTNGRERVHTPE